MLTVCECDVLKQGIRQPIYINTCETVQIVLLPFNYTKNARYVFSLYTPIYKWQNTDMKANT